MDTAVENKLRAIYEEVSGPAGAILDVFIQQFGEPYVDSTIKTCDEFLKVLSTKTLGGMGISEFSDANSYGSYTIDKEDYEKNGRGKTFLEYIPDLGLLDYLKPKFKALILGGNTTFPITVYFPNVRVSNEYDKYIDIQDLYAKVVIDSAGKLIETFKLNRTTYPYNHFKAGYAHSHIPHIDSHSAGCWDNPCLGSGPIRTTQNTLASRYDLNIWGLFVFELSKYVTVESINGGPYARLEEVGRGDILEGFQNLSYKRDVPRPEYRDLIDQFVTYCAIHDKFKVKFVNNQYLLGEGCVSFIVNLSNTFLEWLNYSARRRAVSPTFAELKDRGILKSFIVANDHIYSASVSNNRSVAEAQRINGRSLFTFKGNTVRLRILVDAADTHTNTTTLLTKEYCEYIITRILKIINYKYGKRKGQTQRAASTTQSSAQATAQADLGEKCCII